MQRAKFPSSRPADQLTLDRQKQEAFRDQVLDSTQNQRSCDITASWLQSSQLRFLRGAVDRRVQAALDQQEVHVAERRDRSVSGGRSLSPPVCTRVSPPARLVRSASTSLMCPPVCLLLSQASCPVGDGGAAAPAGDGGDEGDVAGEASEDERTS